MTELALRLQSDLKEAMRSADITRRDVVRFLRSAIHNVEIERGRSLTDDEIVDVVLRQIKQRGDSIEQFARGGRQDLVDIEKAQIAILEQYLPPQLSEEELLQLAREVVDSLHASGPGDMGRVIPVLRERAGQRAAGNAVAQAARTALSEQGNRAKSG
ncbi:MAG: GatB/YqeY domain-containing protein [Nitrolancea sp.]